MELSEQIKERACMKRAKRWLLSTLSLILILFFLEAALVAWIDPFFHYHAPLSGFPYLVDNQLSQNPGMARHLSYDSVILGSSMTVNFNARWFEELFGLQAVKLPYSGAYPKDQANIMEQIFASKNQVKTVFLGVDVMTYTGGVLETKYPIPEYLYDDALLNDVSYLWNKDVFLNYILRQIVDLEKTDLATVYESWWTDDYYNIQWVMHNYEPPAPVAEEMRRDALIGQTQENLRENLIPFIEAQPDTEFVVFFPPYSILYWNDVLRENHLEATLAQYQHIAQTLLSYDNVRVFYFPGMEEIVTDLNNYADYTHYHSRVSRMMTECFASGEREVKSTEEMAQALEETRAMIERFDFEALFSVDY